ncbi:hypothetical protein BDV97DRAFT_786 [Delphinella strobiligena]|nr:hypothetical protein BDV97DRAFT_786 [Delphinella strobiligena]
MSEAVDLLGSKSSADTNSEGQLKDLAEELDRIPLAIIQTAAYMRQNRKSTLTQYLNVLRSSRTDQKALLEFRNSDPRGDRKASNAILTTWEISFKQIKMDFPASAALLSVLSMFDRQGIPDYLISSNKLHDCDFKSLDKLTEFEIAQAISVLAGLSFISLGPVGTTFSMHRLAPPATRAWLDCELAYARFSSAAESILANAYPLSPLHEYRKCREIEPHTNVLSTTCKDTFELSSRKQSYYIVVHVTSTPCTFGTL